MTESGLREVWMRPAVALDEVGWTSEEWMLSIFEVINSTRLFICLGVIYLNQKKEKERKELLTLFGSRIEYRVDITHTASTCLSK